MPPDRILIVDDEEAIREIVHSMLSMAGYRCQQAGSGAEALAIMESGEQFELMLSDLMMGEMDGIALLERTKEKYPDMPVVMVTAVHDISVALAAIRNGAYDYLLKPFNNARFARALERAKERIAHRRQASARMDRLTIKNAGSVVFLPPAGIDWIEAADYYASLHVGPKTHLLRRSMNDLESDLDPSQFCRIHRSTIVNLDRVRELRFDSDAEYELVLADGTKLRLSRRYRKDLQSRLGQSVDVKVPL